MKGLMAVLGLVAIAAAGYFVLGSKGQSFGATPSAPLGQIAKIEQYLVTAGLDKHDMEPVRTRHLLGPEIYEREGVTVTEYRDKVAGYKHYVVLVKDSGGKLIAVAGQIRSGAMGFSKIGTKCEVFLAKFWLATFPTEPTFESKYDPSLGMAEYFIATGERGGVRGVWRKDSPGSNMNLSHQVHDKISFWLK